MGGTMVLPVNTEVLDKVCMEVALDNGGLLYLRGHRDRIQEEYSASEKVKKLSKYKSKVSQEDIKNHLIDWSDGKDLKHIRDEQLFFFNPFESKSDKSNQLYDVLTDIFNNQRYISSKELESKFRSASIEIAEDDVPEYISVLTKRDLVEVVDGVTTFYKPGSQLKEDNDFSNLEEQLSSAADTNGCITHSDLEDFLGIAVVDEILDDLVLNEEVLLELENKYLINTEECRRNYIQSLSDSNLRRKVKKHFKDNSYAASKKEIKELVDNHLQSELDLSKLTASDNLVSQAVNSLISSFETNEVSITNDDGSRIEIYELQEDNKFDDNVRSEAQDIINKVEGEIKRESPGSFNYIIENKVEPKIEQYSNIHYIDQHITEKIQEAAKEELDNSEKIPVNKEL